MVAVLAVERENATLDRTRSAQLGHACDPEWQFMTGGILHDNLLTQPQCLQGQNEHQWLASPLAAGALPSAWAAENSSEAVWFRRPEALKCRP